VPQRVRNFIVYTGSPSAGWWPIIVSADGAIVEIWASNVYDPLPNLLAWLERLVSNGAARVLIDEEGMQKEFLVYPKEQELVRLIVLHHFDMVETRLDVMLNLRDLVGQLYAAIRRLAVDEVFDREWLFNDEQDAAPRPRLSSETVEAFLSRVRSG
jgi:hypothetical protein